MKLLLLLLMVPVMAIADPPRVEVEVLDVGLGVAPAGLSPRGVALTENNVAKNPLHHTILNLLIMQNKSIDVPPYNGANAAVMTLIHEGGVDQKTAERIMRQSDIHEKNSATWVEFMQRQHPYVLARLTNWMEAQQPNASWVEITPINDNEVEAVFYKKGKEVRRLRGVRNNK